MALGSAAVELHNGFRLRYPISRERSSIVIADILVGAISAHADRADDAGTSGAAGARRSRHSIGGVRVRSMPGVGSIRFGS
jgi:hypothetical protein